MLSNRLKKRYRHLGKWARRESVTCFRIYDRDIPEIPLTVDWYDGDVVVSHYERFAQDEEWLTAMLEAIESALDQKSDRIFVKRRGRQRGNTQYERLSRGGRTKTVEEGGHRFGVNLTDYVDTGLFLDHRTTRALVAKEVSGKRFLNLFCYTGSFTVYAARAGATSSLSVDMSGPYTDWAKDNLALNDIDSRVHKVICEEAGEFLALAAERSKSFDVAIVDPPTFSNSKKMARELDLERDHPDLLGKVARVMAPGGVVFFSTNKRRFVLDESALTARGFGIEDWTDRSSPPDFHKRPHRLWRLTAPDKAARPTRQSRPGS